MILDGKRGLIIGVANDKSIAYGIAKACHKEGANLIFTYLNDAIKKRVDVIANEFNSKDIYKLDATNEDEIKNLRDEIRAKFTKIDFIVHSIAFAPKSALSGSFLDTTKEDFDIALNTSVYSLISISRYFKDVLNKDASILTLSYLGSNKVVPNYNIMGVAKAALESSVRYLASDLGKYGIRVNSLSAGPVKTLASSAIGDFKKMLEFSSLNSPLKRNVTLDDVGKSGMYLISDLSSGVTGEVHFVDSGYNINAVPDFNIFNFKKEGEI